MRINNPGGLIITGDLWKGKTSVPLDPRFVSFTEIKHGIRANLINLRNGYIKAGLNTIGEIMRRYAPPHENSTTNYIKFLQNWMGGNPKITMNNLHKLAAGIFHFETAGEHTKYWGNKEKAIKAVNQIKKEFRI